MAARVGEETVKAPGALVVTVYAACTDVTLTVTPDLKSDDGVLLLIDTSAGKRDTGRIQIYEPQAKPILAGLVLSTGLHTTQDRMVLAEWTNAWLVAGRTGGTALAHVYRQLGDEPPDVDSPATLASAFNTLQEMA